MHLRTVSNEIVKIAYSGIYVESVSYPLSLRGECDINQGWIIRFKTCGGLDKITKAMDIHNILETLTFIFTHKVDVQVTNEKGVCGSTGTRSII